jgi:hypothetical protein
MVLTEVRKLEDHFESLNIHHVSRDNNVAADVLSKLGSQDTHPLLTVKFRQPSHEFTFGVDMSFILYPFVLTLLV